MNVDKQTIQAHPVEDYIMGVIDSIRQIALDKEMKMGLTTGFNSIDEVTGGFQGGDLITIAGSASTGKGSNANAWFVGFAPFDDPEIAVAVYVKNGQHGSNTAPIARDIFAQYLGMNSSSVTEDMTAMGESQAMY